MLWSAVAGVAPLIRPANIANRSSVLIRAGPRSSVALDKNVAPQKKQMLLEPFL